MNTREILIGARKLIEKPENWTQGAKSRDINGKPSVFGYKASAVCWCMLGAMEMTGKSLFANNKAQQVIELVINMNSIIRWNDSPDRTHAEVLAAFDRAIELCSED